MNFSTPFSEHFAASNRQVRLSHEIPWDSIVNVYHNHFNNHATGPSNINPRIVLGALMVKHMLNISDVDTIQMIKENLYIQYFLGFDSLTSKVPFDSSLFVEVRKRLGMDQLNRINDAIYQASKNNWETIVKESAVGDQEDDIDLTSSEGHSSDSITAEETTKTIGSMNESRMLVDATACPQDIAFPTDLELLNASREKCQEIIDNLYDSALHGAVKPRTQREKTRRAYLNTAKKKNKMRAELKVAIGKQLRFVNRDLKTIAKLLSMYRKSPLTEKDHRYVETIRKVFAQQTYMRRNKTHSVVQRIVSIHQPHVRPIVRGKEKMKVEFGSKINVSMVDGYAFLDHLSWDAYNEGGFLMQSVEFYKTRHGHYPSEVMADKCDTP